MARRKLRVEAGGGGRGGSGEGGGDVSGAVRGVLLWRVKGVSGARRACVFKATKEYVVVGRSAKRRRKEETVVGNVEERGDIKRSFRRRGGEGGERREFGV